MKYILAIDQGTTSTRSILFDERQRVAAAAQRSITQIYPQPGWVEHDPDEIFAAVMYTISEVLKRASADISDVISIGITNQRETSLIWDAKTGKPIMNAVVWQCRRSSEIVSELVERGMGNYIQATTGLVPDAYFSATKIKWMLDNIPGAREDAVAGRLLFGTVDSWLIWKLTDGRIHATDYTNASRTMLYDIRKLEWDTLLLDTLSIPRSMLPEVLPSCGKLAEAEIFGSRLPITGIAGDQQAALFGQRCFEPGSVKNTYGTGLFMLMNTGANPIVSSGGLLTSLAASADGNAAYCLEGSVFAGGSIAQWLRDEMGMITAASDIGKLAATVPNSGGVYFVPAFNGLGSPYWDSEARGLICGITRGTNRAHIARACEEAVALQTYDLVKAFETDAGVSITELKADGGASSDDFLMQTQADVANIPVVRSNAIEATALGAAYLAGIGAGIWSQRDIIAQDSTGFEPCAEPLRRAELLSGWNDAVRRATSVHSADA